MTTTALWMGVFGETFAALGWLMVLVGVALTIGVFAISRRLIHNSFLVYLPTLLFLISGYGEWPLLSYHWFALTFYVWSLVFLMDWTRTQSFRNLLAAGVAIGLAGACLQSEGAAGGLGAFGVMLWVHWNNRSWNGFLKNLGWLLLGIALVWIPLIGTLVLTGSFGNFVDNTITSALSDLYRGLGYDQCFDTEICGFVPGRHLDRSALSS